MQHRDRPLTDLEVSDLLAEAINVFQGHVAMTQAGRTTIKAALRALAMFSAALVVIVDEEGEG